ncbi:MAG: hypothetical protein ACYTF3_10055 [Planctomycetota bacterium]|jgi:hypothetical protein
MKPSASLFLLLAAAALAGGALALLLRPLPVAAQGTADAGSRYVAATGQYMDNTSLLYVLDQETQRLAVYEARGGAENSRRVVFIGARNIELDTLLDGFNDESEYSHAKLEEEFRSTGIPTPDSGANGGG